MTNKDLKNYILYLKEEEERTLQKLDALKRRREQKLKRAHKKETLTENEAKTKREKEEKEKREEKEEGEKIKRRRAQKKRRKKREKEEKEESILNY